MSGVHLRTFLGHLRRRLALGERGAAVPDGRLLARFVATRDEAAFELLIWRHGGMVYNVCRRLLFREQDIEDAFQATFLVLIRKAVTIGKEGSLAAWLYRVAFRVALRSRGLALKRQKRENKIGLRIADLGSTSLDPQSEIHNPKWAGLRPALDEELNGLPTRYREVLVLCYLQGKTNQEAAAELGCPCGTVFSRLARGRDLLRRRLLRRGVTPSTVLAGASDFGLRIGDCGFGIVQSEIGIPQSQVGGRLVTATLQLGRDATGVPDSILSLTEGVIHAMLMKKLQGVSVLAVSIFVMFSGLALLASASQGSGVRSQGADSSGDRSDESAGAYVAQVAQVAQAGQQKGAGGGSIQGKGRLEAKESEPSVAGSAPVVVKTEPQAGDTQVDAGIVKEIRVTFSKDMNEKGYSFSQISGEHFPKGTGKASFIDKRTCVYPVKLEPGKAYVIWLNPQKFQGFRDTDGRPAVFYPLVFETKR